MCFIQRQKPFKDLIDLFIKCQHQNSNLSKNILNSHFVDSVHLHVWFDGAFLQCVFKYKIGCVNGPFLGQKETSVLFVLESDVATGKVWKTFHLSFKHGHNMYNKRHVDTTQLFSK